MEQAWSASTPENEAHVFSSYPKEVVDKHKPDLSGRSAEHDSSVKQNHGRHPHHNMFTHNIPRRMGTHIALHLSGRSAEHDSSVKQNHGRHPHHNMFTHNIPRRMETHIALHLSGKKTNTYNILGQIPNGCLVRSKWSTFHGVRPSSDA